MISCQVYETLRTPHVWELEYTRSSRMLKHLLLLFIHKLFEHLPHTLFNPAFHWPSFYCHKPDGLHCPRGWLLQSVAFQFRDLHIADDFSLCLCSAICSNGYSLEFIVLQNCSPPKYLHSVFSLSGHHLLSLVIQVLPPQLFLNYIRTSSPLA